MARIIVVKQPKTYQVITLLFLLLTSCSQTAKFGEETKLKNKEFDDLVKVERVKVISSKPVEKKEIKIKEVKQVIKEKTKKIVIKKKVSIKALVPAKVKSDASLKEKVNEVVPGGVTPQKKEEEIKEVISEDVLKNAPFRVGEKTKIEVSYLNMTAGYLTLETKGIVKVNGRLSYHFRGTIKSRKLFSFVYSVDDVADTYVDIENMRPSSLIFKVVETKKTKNSKTFFNWKTKKATYWSRKVRKGRKPKEVKKVWNLVPGAQNFVSSLFYLRTIDFSKNRSFSFPMADEGKNVTLKGRVIKKEKVSTDAGTFDAWLVEPKFHINGSLAPVGQLRMWFKADKSQNLVKVETKLKFGSIVGEAAELVRGENKGLESYKNSSSSQSY